MTCAQCSVYAVWTGGVLSYRCPKCGTECRPLMTPALPPSSARFQPHHHRNPMST